MKHVTLLTILSFIIFLLVGCGDQVHEDPDKGRTLCYEKLRLLCGDIAMMKIDSNASISEAVGNLQKTNRIRMVCPYSGNNYLINPADDLWKLSSTNTGVAIFCPGPHKLSDKNLH